MCVIQGKNVFAIVLEKRAVLVIIINLIPLQYFDLNWYAVVNSFHTRSFAYNCVKIIYAYTHTQARARKMFVNRT